MKSFIDVITSRRSVRAFNPLPLAEEDIEQIIRCGMQAPSAHNKQPWVFLTITERDTLMKIKPLCKWWGMLETAGLAIVNCMNLDDLGDNPREFFVDSCCAASENMILAAHSMGLGATWLGVCKGSPFYDEFCELLNIPANLEVVNMIAIGVPSGTRPEPINRFNPDKWVKEHF